ncbi:MAG: cellulase family glycosylhydrolase [Fibrobacter sp.]|nr:cellulase family glycosylhydrolase [Fibrobacter sp.]
MRFLSIPALACAMTLGFGLASAQTITPTRVGPVSQYGQLMTGKNSAGEGRIYGSCEGVKDGAEVQVRGMSLYWSLQPQAVEYWSEEGVSTMVKDMNIQIVRAAMATGNEDWWGEWNGQRLKGYASAPDQQKGFMKAVVEAAIKNDIYVIIDWHSHEATSQVTSANGFFEEMAKTYGQYDNVIFELFNEPTDISWDNIKNYANQIIPTIRQYSDNLILVGTRAWDQHPEEVIGKEVTDSKKNTAYTLHYYANSHCVSGNYDWGGGCEGSNGEKAIKAGLSVFVSEWGTGDANGGGTPDQNKNTQWQTFINKYKLSWANWSASHISEGTAAFGSGSNKTSLNYTTSGNLVKGYLATNPTNYAKCATGGNQGSSTTDPSQGGQQQGGAQQGGTDPNQQQGGQNQWGQNDDTGFLNLNAESFDVSFSSKALQISGSKSATVELFDMKGHKLMMIDGVSGTLSLAKLPAGQYMVRVKAGSASKVQAISIK